jgi:hypothetical protein
MTSAMSFAQGPTRSGDDGADEVRDVALIVVPAVMLPIAIRNDLQRFA